jgi:outer membrane receptor for ferrienterochelin and colicins|tara:strand:+ start:131859 stop:134129 length:2271 start_codon:yes stop_codon:yes gene_type:complete
MKKKLLNILFFVCYLPITIYSQGGAIEGVISSNSDAVAFANIGLSGTKLGTAADVNGKFKLNNIPVGTYTVQVSAVGYKHYKKTITIESEKTITLNITIEETATQIEEFVVTGTLREVSIKESAVPIKVYKPTYFLKNPTPVLFEALQIVNGVRPQINCSVCNTGDIHINGMEGPYTMVTIDGMPIVGGLSTVYGLNGIPNSMIAQTEVVKGPASTLFGSEAVGGLINVITLDPKDSPKLAVDVFATTWGEINTDIGMGFKINEKVTSMLGINYFNYSNPIDNNGDNFTDLTLQDRISIFNKWDIKRKENREFSVAMRYVYEDRWGGEMQWTPEFRGGDSIYGESIYTSRYEIIGKYQLPVKERLMSSFSFSDHQQNSVYGNVPYIAHQKIAFGQLFWDKKVGKHDWLIGTAIRYNFYDDNTAATQTADTDTLNPKNKPDNAFLPGIFIQHSYKINTKHKTLVGLRYDYDSRHGNIFTPRFNYKWTPNESNTIRLSLGTGYRVVNLFTEDHAATTGAREIVIKGSLSPETSYNANLNYQKIITTKFGFINFDISGFYTYFNNKIIPDYETNSKQIIYENLNGYAVSRGISFDMDITFSAPLNIKLGGTFMDVFEVSENELGNLEKQPQLLTENISGTFGVSYEFTKRKIKIDYTGNVYGPMKLPLVENDFRPEYSDWYSIQNIQITKEFKKGWEVYGGVKNLLNFTPPNNSILRANDPFDKNVNSSDNPNGYTFDPTYVYTTFQGIRGFLGARVRF